MANRFSSSLAALYASLERPRVARRAVFALLAIHSLLLGYSAYVHSPNLNEPSHLVAGITHWRFNRFDLYRVNPPLVRMVAALPVIAAGYEEDWSGYFRAPGARPVFRMGEDFIAANGERSFLLFAMARWICIPFSWIGAIVCYLWARDLYGRPAGVLACAIWCFEPNILAHGAFFTPDGHATALGMAACYTFWRWLKKPTWTQAAFTGVTLGLAELAKSTLILFYPLWPLMWLIYRWPDRAEMTARDWLREAGMLAARMAVGLYVLNLCYAFEGSFTRLGDFHFISKMFVGESRAEEVPGARSSSLPQNPDSETPPRVNRFADTWLAALPMPLPKDYLLGIDIQQRDFENYGRPSYLRGEWRDRGWWYYYLYACAIKVPLGLWSLGGLTIFLRLFCGNSSRNANDPFRELSACAGTRCDRSQASLSTSSWQQGTLARDEFVLLFPAIVIFAVASFKSGFSEHMRYVLPTFPYFFIAISQSIKVIPISRLSPSPFLSESARFSASRAFRTVSRLTKAISLPSVATYVPGLVVFLVSWSVASSLWIYPHSISYFNESIGGPLRGPDHILGSAVDWGHDLRYLKWRLENSFSGQPVHIAYFGYYDASRVGIRHFGVPAKVESLTDLKHLPPGIYAVSVNLLRGFPWMGWDAAGQRRNFPQNALVGLRELTPIAWAGYSIALFQIEDDRNSSNSK